MASCYWKMPLNTWPVLVIVNHLVIHTTLGYYSTPLSLPGLCLSSDGSILHRVEQFANTEDYPFLLPGI